MIDKKKKLINLKKLLKNEKETIDWSVKLQRASRFGRSEKLK